MKKFRSLFYLITAISLLFYGLPRFQLDGFNTMGEGFALIWTFFAFIVIGAQLYEILGVENERVVHLNSVRNQKQEVRALR